VRSGGHPLGISDRIHGRQNGRGSLSDLSGTANDIPGGTGRTTSSGKRQDTGGKGQNPYRRGVFVGLLNPKSAVFFLAFLPQFVREGKGPYALQIVLLGILTVMAGVAIELLLIAVMDKVTDVVKRKQRFMSFIQKATGSLLVGLGIRLALSSQRSN
jgi:threonine/homoserine/homoserine lactone efflux protein